MKWVKDHDPNKDGDYIVARGYSSLEITSFCFTVEGGWNTSYALADGKLMDESALDCHVGDEDGWLKGWLILSDGDPWRAGRPLEDGHYIVAMDDRNIRMSFSVEHGWNALYNPKNKLSDDCVLGWMPIETVKEAFA